MAKAHRNPVAEETFLNYFGMRRPPFGPPADPLEIFDCEQYAFVNERLASTTQHAGRLAVVCGVDGSGKTTLLNRYVANLPEDAVYARFDETCKTGKQFYFEFLKQLGFDEMSGTLGEFRNITREFLIYQGTADYPVVIFVDNAHLVKPSVLDQLRWISATRIKDKKVLSVVLLGNSDLPRVMESPAMRALKFDHRVDFNIRVYTESETDAYVWHCLNASGGANVAKFSNDARAMIYRYTRGIPGQINTLCSATLAEACVRENRVIHDKLVRVVADKEKMLPHAVPLKSKGRRKTDESYVSNIEAELAELAEIAEIVDQVETVEDQSDAGKSVSKKTGTKLKATTAKRANKTAKAELRKSKALIEKLEKRVEDLQALVATYVSDLTMVQAQLRAQAVPSDKKYAPHDAILNIEVLKDGQCVQDLDISQGQSRIMIGRAEDSELRLCGSFVSRHHALVVVANDGVFIEDLKSFNGTIVNGTKIRRRELSPGDKIVIGDYELRTKSA
jgi:type II secretory pathway predicted ATPase ExeA